MAPSGVNISYKWKKLFPDGHFRTYNFFPEMMRISTIYLGFLKRKYCPPTFFRG